LWVTIPVMCNDKLVSQCAARSGPPRYDKSSQQYVSSKLHFILKKLDSAPNETGFHTSGLA